MSVVALRPSADGPPLYPLPARASLAQFRSINFAVGEFLGSELAASPREARAAVGAWVFLLANAFATQQPGGTLPLSEARLAWLAGYGDDVAGWGAVRAVALLGWERVRVETADGEPAGERLAHPRVTAEAVRLWAEAQRMAAARDDNARDQARKRIRARLKELGAARGLFEAGRVEAMRLWLAGEGRRITQRDVQVAIMATMGAGAEAAR